MVEAAIEQMGEERRWAEGRRLVVVGMIDHVLFGVVVIGQVPMEVVVVIRQVSMEVVVIELVVGVVVSVLYGFLVVVETELKVEVVVIGQVAEVVRP